MACTAQTAKKTTGGPAKRLMLACPEAASQPAVKCVRLTSSTSDVVVRMPFVTYQQLTMFLQHCSLCEEGGDLFECNKPGCHRAVCTHCLDVPADADTLSKLTSAGIQFCCVACHWAMCRHAPCPYVVSAFFFLSFPANNVSKGFTENDKPVLNTFLKVKGTFQTSTKASIYTMPTLLLHFRLQSIRHYAHFNIIKDALRGYYPDNGRLHTVDIPFNLETEKAQLVWPDHAGEIVTHIHTSGFKCVVAVVTNHTDDDRGNFWFSGNEDGKEPGAAAVDDVGIRFTVTKTC